MSAFTTLATLKLVEIEKHGAKMEWRRPGAGVEPLWMTRGATVQLSVALEGERVRARMEVVP